MLNKKSLLFVWMAAVLCVAPARGADADAAADDKMEDVAADAIADYQVDGSLFQQITDLEQEKVLMQLEKERAQLDLELDRLAAEKIKLHMEIDALSGRAEAQQQELEAEKAKLEAEAERLEREREALKSAPVATASARQSTTNTQDTADEKISDLFKLVNVIGAGSQLQATVADLKTGQSKRVKVGAVLDGFTVKSISLDDGVVFVKDDVTQMLNVGSGK